MIEGLDSFSFNSNEIQLELKHWNSITWVTVIHDWNNFYLSKKMMGRKKTPKNHPWPRNRYLVRKLWEFTTNKHTNLELILRVKNTSKKRRKSHCQPDTNTLAENSRFFYIFFHKESIFDVCALLIPIHRKLSIWIF